MTESTTSSITDDFQLGDPIAITRAGARVLGRVCGFSGTPYRGLYPVVHLKTPHGSELYAGRFFVERITSEDDRAALLALEAEGKL